METKHPDPAASSERGEDAHPGHPVGVQIYDRPASADRLPWARILLVSIPLLISVLLSVLLAQWIW